MSLELEEARHILDAALAKGQAMGLRVSIAVVDSIGDLVALARMDGSRRHTADIARGKAMVSAIFGQPSGSQAERAGTAIGQAVNRFYNSGLVYHQGAVPIMRDGQVVGAVGVSGARSDEDEEIARAGAETAS